MKMPGWHDLKYLSTSIREDGDEAGVLESLQTVNGLIDEQVKNGIPLDRILVGGFSQGSAMAIAVSIYAQKGRTILMIDL